MTTKSLKIIFLSADMGLVPAEYSVEGYGGVLGHFSGTATQLIKRTEKRI